MKKTRRRNTRKTRKIQRQRQRQSRGGKTRNTIKRQRQRQRKVRNNRKRQRGGFSLVSAVAIALAAKSAVLSGTVATMTPPENQRQGTSKDYKTHIGRTRIDEFQGKHRVDPKEQYSLAARIISKAVIDKDHETITRVKQTLRGQHDSQDSGDAVATNWDSMTYKMRQDATAIGWTKEDWDTPVDLRRTFLPGHMGAGRGKQLYRELMQSSSEKGLKIIEAIVVESPPSAPSLSLQRPIEPPRNFV